MQSTLQPTKLLSIAPALMLICSDITSLISHEEIDFDWFMEVLRNNELQVVSRKLTKEDDEEICRAIDDYNATQQEIPVTEAILA